MAGYSSSSQVRSSKSSKVTKPSSNQSTLSSFFGLSQPSKSSTSLRGSSQRDNLVRSVSASVNSHIEEIDLTSDDSDILRDISNKKSLLRSISSTGFDEHIPDDDDSIDTDITVKDNLKSKRPIGSFIESKENGIDYSRTTTLGVAFNSGSFDDHDAEITSSSSLSSQKNKQRALPWAKSSSNTVLNKAAFKNPRLNSAIAKVETGVQRSRTSSAISLSDEQRQVLKYILEDKLNVFYTGSAGTGKSVLLKELIKRLYKKYGSQCVAVTASTGLAAVNIGGQTINRFAGIGIGKEPVDVLISKINKSRASEKWKKVRVIIIDEVSMIDGNLFNKLNQIAKLVRRNNSPFGGIQMVITGDFFQLPPVPDRSGPRPIFCFQSPAWQEVIQRTVLLTKVFRQKGDTQLIDMLNALRIGEVNDSMIAQFRSLQRPVQYEDGLEPTELFPLRHEVDRANKVRLDKLPSPIQSFRAIDTGTQQFLGMLDNVMAVKELHLKEDAQVMMLKNKNEFIVNGSIGRVLYFVTPNLWEQITKTFRADLDSVETIQAVRILRKCVGISSFPAELSNEVNSVRTPNFVKLVQLATREKEGYLLPVVKFSSTDGLAELQLVEPDDFTIDVKGGSINRKQLPLLLSWALSIHKSQGQTLERVKVDLNKVFENGQVYVALSRAVSKERLQIVGFNPVKIRCSPDVRKFYDSLERLN